MDTLEPQKFKTWGHMRPLKKAMKELERWFCSLSRGLEFKSPNRPCVVQNCL